MNPYLSIIIPTLNEEKSLPKLLECLLKQNYPNFEIIVVDGQSKDKTISFVKEYQRKFKSRQIILSLITSDRSNASFQRNLGAMTAKGEYLVFFDADILILPDYLMKLHKEIIKRDLSKNLITTWVLPDQNGFFEWGVTLFLLLMIEAGKLISRPIAPGFNTILTKKAFLNIGGFDPKVGLADDYDFSIRADKKGYKLKSLKNPKIIFSLRRFRAKGFLRASYDYLKIVLYGLFIGVPKTDVFEYPMGGHVHESLKHENTRTLKQV